MLPDHPDSPLADLRGKRWGMLRHGSSLSRVGASGKPGAVQFLNAVEAAVPSGKAIHAILDNVATHKHPKVRAWLARHPRWTFHFTPTSASWLNAVEGFFSALTRRRLRRGSLTGVVDLQAAIKRYIAEHNRRARPFIWTKTRHRHPRCYQPIP
jgi:transposase